jgi:hypothetical protein
LPLCVAAFAAVHLFSSSFDVPCSIVPRFQNPPLVRAWYAECQISPLKGGGGLSALCRLPTHLSTFNLSTFQLLSLLCAFAPSSLCGKSLRGSLCRCASVVPFSPSSFDIPCSNVLRFPSSLSFIIRYSLFICSAVPFCLSTFQLVNLSTFLSCLRGPQILPFVERFVLSTVPFIERFVTGYGHVVNLPLCFNTQTNYYETNDQTMRPFCCPAATGQL